MDIEFTEEQRAFREVMRKVAEREFAKYLPKAEEDETFPKQLIKDLGKLRYLCVAMPEKYGGSGADATYSCIQAEEFAKVNLGFSVAIGVQTGTGPEYICRYGTEEQKQKFLIPAVKGEKITGFANTEPDGGSDRSAMKTTARRKGDYYIVNGSKTYITMGTICDFMPFSAWFIDENGKKNMALFIVEEGAPGFTRGRKLLKCGCRSSENSELFFEDCKIPVANIIGNEKNGPEIFLHGAPTGRVLTAARAVGVARASFEAAVKYAQQRIIFGKPLGRHQAISVKLANIATEIEAASLLVYKTAFLISQGKLALKEAAMAKLFACEMAARVTSEIVHIHGAYGYMRESLVEQYFRDARYLSITKGPSEKQQMIIAEEIGLYEKGGSLADLTIS
jgi:alkylation response protein AidB-like acyl-CoA dehydrogenase